MHLNSKFLHDRLVLGLMTLLSALLVIGISLVFLRFDASKNPTTVAAYRPSLSGSSYVSGKPLDIYLLAVYMIFTTLASMAMAAHVYPTQRSIAVFILSSGAFLLVMATVVANSLISLQ